MRVLVRADATRRWGLGHLARCTSLALALRRAGHAVSFACRDDGSGIAAERCSLHGFQHLPLMYEDAEDDDARETLLLARAIKADRVVVDHYGLGERWWRTVAAEVPLLAIDDMGRAGLGAACAMVLNQNVGARKEWYPGGATLLMGPRHVLLPAEILPRRVAREHVLGPLFALRPRRVLLTVGGSDPLGAMPRLMHAAARQEQLDRIDVAIGPGFGDTNALEALADGDARFVLHRGLPSLLDLLMQVDAIITAAGTTTYEAACLGVPMALVALFDNQQGIARGMADEGAAFHIQEWDEMNKLREAMATFLADGEGLVERARRAMRLVDGLGAVRVADALADCLPSRAASLTAESIEVHLRPATSADALLLLEWRNDPVARAASHNTAEIALEDHLRWLTETLSSDRRRLYIAEVAGIPVGSVRQDIGDHESELSWTISEKFRRRGLGQRMVGMLAQTITTEITARIKVGNTASIRIAEACGMALEREESGVLYYRRPGIEK